MESPNNSSESTGNGYHNDRDRLLPSANIARIMKKSLPASAKISKETKDTVQECVSEFITFVTSEAADKCHHEKRKTVTGDDLLWAMETLGFDNYVGPVQSYLNKSSDIGDFGNVENCHNVITQSSEYDYDQINDPVAPNISFSEFDGGYYESQSNLVGFSGGGDVATAEEHLPDYFTWGG